MKVSRIIICCSVRRPIRFCVVGLGMQIIRVCIINRGGRMTAAGCCIDKPFAGVSSACGFDYFTVSLQRICILLIDRNTVCPTVAQCPSGISGRRSLNSFGISFNIITGSLNRHFHSHGIRNARFI